MITQLDGLKQWKCANGHVLGVVERVTYANSLGQTRHVTRLLLFRHAIDASQEHPAEVEVIGPLEGTMPGIICDVEGCGEVRPWEMGRDAVERLIEKLTPQPAKQAFPQINPAEERGTRVHDLGGSPDITGTSGEIR